MTTEIRPPAAHQRPSGRMYLSANQLDLANNTWTIVELDAISAGFTDGIENTVTHRITPGVAGFYTILGSVTFYNPVAARNYRAYIRLNGITYINGNIGWCGGGLYFSLPIAGLVKMTATDYLELIARSDSGDNTVDIINYQTVTFLSVQRAR